MKLKIASDLSLPLDVVTQTIAVLAKRRAGKSYTMRRLVEQLLQAGQQVVIVDPKGDQWGLRSAANGKDPGLPIVILGGERGDAPLETSSGEVVAKLVVEERVSVLLDLSQFRKHEVATFMTAFMENLYRLKAKEIYRTPMMLVMDEADAIAPQKPQKGEERMLGAAEDIVRRGGQRGIGCVFVTQRSAVLNKNVLTQAQILVVLRTIAPQDLAAMDAWIDVHGEPEQRKTLMESLPSLPIGDAWFWSPGWPTVDGIFKRVHILPIETFDSGASPKPGVKPVEPKRLADVDLEALKRQMAATIEKAKADDPKQLRKRIAELEREVKTSRPIEKVSGEIRKVEVLTDADRAVLAKVGESLEDTALLLHQEFELAGQRLRDHMEQLAGEYGGQIIASCVRAEKQIGDLLDKVSVQRALAKVSAAQPAPRVVERSPQPVGQRVAHSPRRHARAGSSPALSANSDRLPPGEHATLTAALQYPDGLDRKRLSVLTGYKRSSRDAYIARLQAKDLITVQGQFLYPTDAGRSAMNGSFEALPTGRDLIEYWMDRLPEGERSTFAVLVNASGGEVAREQIDHDTGYKRSSRDAYLTRLKARGLVEFSGRGTVRASNELFG